MFNQFLCVTMIILLTACGGNGQQSASSNSSINNISSSKDTTSSVASTSSTDSNSSSGSEFTLTSTAVVEGGEMPDAYGCDGEKASMPLSWSHPPANTVAYVVLMTTIPGPGTTKWNWVLYDIPNDITNLAMNSSGIGTLGVADNGAGRAYSPPCSKGAGTKIYTFTVYALSALPSFSVGEDEITGQVVSDAIESITLGTAVLNVTHTRFVSSSSSSTSSTTTDSATAATNCALIKQSTVAYAAHVSVDCSSSDYGKIASDGLATHTMMDGITATNLHVPLPQAFTNGNEWKIPLNPHIANTTTSVDDGPVGVAINGVPIFNPCKQGGCQNGDTKVLGELDICNGHAGRAEDYHYHAAPTCLMADQPAAYWNTHPIGWALDGFAIYGYNNADGSTATRDDICGGNTSPVTNGPAGYSYHVTDASPYFMSCLRGAPSPDLAGQNSKYKPMRVPPVVPMSVSNMTLTTDPSDGYQVLTFTTANSFVSTETGQDSYTNNAGTYRIRYKAVTGTALANLLAQNQNAGKTNCWNFQFVTNDTRTSQPAISYCK